MPTAASKSKSSVSGKLVSPKLFVRIRPKATDSGGHDDSHLAGVEVAKQLKSWTEDTISLNDKTYTFPTKVLSPMIPQKEVFNLLMPDLIDSFTTLGGKNVLIFAYGQSGTGKTHTIFGPSYAMTEAYHADWGILLRTAQTVFDIMDSKPHISYHLTLSAIEFYLWGCGDLLNNRCKVEISEGTREPIGHVRKRITSTKDIKPILDIVNKTRTARGTTLNGRTAEHGGSSRSHAALIFTLNQVDTSTGESCKTIMNIVDLAGAERPGKNGCPRTSAYEAYLEMKQGKVSTGAEAVTINYELFNIGREIQNATSCHRANRPYTTPKQFTSPATHFLGSCFDGKALLGMIVTLSQSVAHGWETWFSLQYGQDVSRLQCRVANQPIRALRSSIGSVVNAESKAAADLARTAPNGTPGSKYYPIRRATATDLKDSRTILETLCGEAGLDCGKGGQSVTSSNS